MLNQRIESMCTNMSGTKNMKLIMEFMRCSVDQLYTSRKQCKQN